MSVVGRPTARSYAPHKRHFGRLMARLEAVMLSRRPDWRRRTPATGPARGDSHRRTTYGLVARCARAPHRRFRPRRATRAADHSQHHIALKQQCRTDANHHQPGVLPTTACEAYPGRSCVDLVMLPSRLGQRCSKCTIAGPRRICGMRWKLAGKHPTTIS